MMQCKCCMHTVPDGSAVCDICGFPLLASKGVDMTEIGARFRKGRLENCSIAVKFYYYEADDVGNLVEKNSDYVLVSGGLSLKYHEVFWFGEKFDPPEVDREIVLEIRLRIGDKSIDNALRAVLTKALKCSRLGLYLDDGLTVRFAVGSKEDYVLSDAASLIGA